MSILGSSTNSLHQHSSATTTAATSDHKIDLLDRTGAERDPETSRQDDSGDETPDTPASTESSNRLSRTWTRGTLRKELARRKYREWQEERSNEDRAASAREETSTTDAVNDQQGPIPRSEGLKNGDEQVNLIAPQTSRLRRGKDRVKAIVSTRNRVHKTIYEDVAVDILYENQRGSFFFGIPLFSHKSLLNFDPSPWVNGYGKKSRVNITNAQLPDPSWEWAWKSWYVDMSHDVDEEGWEYSFSFQKGFAWHGTHPWFHSFVRRRRWLRKRVRKHSDHAHEQGGTNGKLKQAKTTSSEYLTHSRSNSPRSSVGTSQARSSSVGRMTPYRPEEELNQGVHDIATLMRQLKRAAVDREKLVAVRAFLAQGGREVRYLADKMPHIMSLFVFQTSRRQLLTILMQTYDAACTYRDERLGKGDAEDEKGGRSIEFLLNAVKAADDEVKRLEYWSDIRDMARNGQTLRAADETYGWGREWQGIDSSGPDASRAHTSDYENAGGTDDVTTTEHSEVSPTETSNPSVGPNNEIRRASHNNEKNSEPEDQLRQLDKGKGRAEEIP